jgi:trimeric autotransporter adhesin
MKPYLLLGILFCLSFSVNAQSMAINNDGSTADASAILDIKSMAKGLLVPRMTKAEKNNITSPANGLLVYQTGPDSSGFHYYNGSQWTWISTAANAWQLGGNVGTNAATQFIGTIDNNPLVFRTQNTEAMRMTSTGVLGIGTSTPNSTYGFAHLELASEGFGAPTDLLIRNAANDAGYAPGLVFQHARGTLATPLTVNSGDYLSAISTMNYDGSNFVLSAGLDIYADGAVATGIVPTRLQFLTMNTAGSYSTRLTIKNDGKTGIGTTAPFSLLANNSSNNGGSDGIGLNTNSIDWSMNQQGYVLGLYNAATGGGANGLLIKAAGTTASNRLLDVSIGSTQNSAGTAVFVVRGNTTVGIGTGTPHSTLQVDGSIAVGVTMGLAGGAIATPVSLANLKAYIGCSPADNTNNFYQLPDPATCAGRIYYIRNNSSSFFANIVTAGGSIFGGSSATVAGGNTYTLNPTTAAKTVICISDGTNWTVGRID